MSRFVLTYTPIKRISDIDPKKYVFEGPEVDNIYKDEYWFYNDIIDVDPYITHTRLSNSLAVETTRKGLLIGSVTYILFDRQEQRYIRFWAGKINDKKNKMVQISRLGSYNRETNTLNDPKDKVPINYDNYKDLINEIIRMVSLINEKKENENDKITLVFIKRSIENYTQDKIKWETPSVLGQFKPTILTKIGLNDELKWIPNTIISEGKSNLTEAIGTQNNIDTDKHFKNGGKRKSRKSKKSKKSKKRNYSNKNHLYRKIDYK